MAGAASPKAVPCTLGEESCDEATGDDVAVSKPPASFVVTSKRDENLPIEARAKMRTAVLETGDKPWIGPGGGSVGPRIFVTVTRHDRMSKDKVLDRKAMPKAKKVKLRRNTALAADEVVSLRTPSGAPVPTPLATVIAVVNPHVHVTITGEGVSSADLLAFAPDVEVK